MKLSNSIISIKGLGPKARDKLNAIGIYNLEHLLFQLPFRYQNKTSITPLNKVHAGDEILVQLTIESIETPPTRPSAKTSQLLCYLIDKNNLHLLLRFFHFNQYQKQQLVRGNIIQCFGEIKIGKDGLEMHHPEYRLISKGQKTLLERTLSPIYPLTGNITQIQMKKWINIAMDTLKISPLIDNFESLPNHSMPSLKQALETLHHPKEDENLEQIEEFKHIAQQRLIIEELCAQQLSLLKLKKQRKNKVANIFIIKDTLSNKLHSNLGFELTNAQQRRSRRPSGLRKTNWYHPIIRC